MECVLGLRAMSWVLVGAGILLMATGCGPSKSACEEELKANGFTDIELKRDGNGFSFTAKKGGKKCFGSVSVKQGFGTKESSHSESCGDVDDDAPEDCAKSYSGACFQEGLAAEKAKDFAAAATNYGLGCAQKNPSACSNLGVLNERGNGLPKDLAKAGDLYDQACTLKLPLGCSNRATLYKNAGKPDQALKMFSAACDIKPGEWCAEAAWDLYSGIGTAADVPGATKMFDAACTGGDKRSCGGSGAMLVMGKKSPADTDRGAKMMSDACDAGVVESCENLGIVMKDGTIKPSDFKRSFELFNKSCEKESGRGCNFVGYALEHGQGAPLDLAKAATFYDKACGFGDTMGCENMANFLKLGRGVPIDKARAGELYDKACAAHSESACKARAALK